MDALWRHLPDRGEWSSDVTAVAQSLSTKRSLPVGYRGAGRGDFADNVSNRQENIPKNTGIIRKSRKMPEMVPNHDWSKLMTAMIHLVKGCIGAQV